MAPPSSDASLGDFARRERTDRDAFAALYDHYYPRILRYCIRRLFSRSVAEDVTSDVFLSAVTNIETFRGHSEGEFGQWLYTIATNRIREHLRNGHRRRELLQAAADAGRLRPEAADDATDYLDWPMLYESMAQLNARDQEILSLRFMEDLPYEQIAPLVAMKPGTIRVAISRALDRLRTCLVARERTRTKERP